MNEQYVARLRWEHINEHDGQVTMTLGRQAAPLPRPLGELILRLRAERLGPAVTGASGRGPWLFAGTMLGAPIADSRLTARLRQIGVKPLRGRVGALEHLLQRIPASVLADQIGMSPWTGHKWASLASPDYARYVARRQTQDAIAAADSSINRGTS